MADVPNILDNAGASDIAFSAITVTNASQSFSAANSKRNYLGIQNNHVTGIIYFKPVSAATETNGVRIRPGEFYLFETYVPKGSINIIGSIASNTLVILAEGTG